ncbi:MAG: FAD-dependent oxidoreductase [bacterium]|nr:FAD-dependent oxidoreductase [bacterium]
MKKNHLKVFLLLLIGGLIFVVNHYGLTEWLTLASLKENFEFLQTQIADNIYLSLGIFFLTYVAIVAFSIPGATVMTLAAGALFGLVQGLLLVSFASSVGATISFLVSRYLLRDLVMKRYSDKLTSINNGIAKDGVFYLFTLRLIPVFPFFLINILFGLTGISTWSFYWVSQLGMLAGTAVYVNAGTALTEIDGLSGIFTPGLLLSFTLLGLLPIGAKFFTDYLRGLKVYQGYERPKTFDYNIVVIGAGAAGLVTSYIAAAVKARVLLIEKHKMGGDCLNTGCVPSKALIASAKVVHNSKRVADFGLKTSEVNFEFSEVMERVQRVIKQVEPHDSVERYSELGVECISGAAKIKSPFTVEVNGNTFTTRNIVVASGARPLVPNMPGLDKVEYFTSDTIWNLRQRPEKMVVLGGGPIGSELSQAFSRLGVNVTQVEAYDCILSREDDDVSEYICRRLMKEGVRILTNHRAVGVVVRDNRKYLICHSGAEETGEVEVEFDCLLFALGRKANVSGFGLEELGVQLNSRGTIEADEFLRSNYPNIYVAGDVTGPYQFTHFAAHQAWYAAVNALFSPFRKFRADYRVVPWCTFTDPEVAHVGFNEKAAKEKGIEYEVTHYSIDDLDRAIADATDEGFVKVITATGRDKILGVTIVGHGAGELLAEYVLAMKHGLGLNKILGTIHTYPTMAEANKYAAGVWKKNHAPQNVLRWVERFHSWRRGS